MRLALGRALLGAGDNGRALGLAPDATADARSPPICVMVMGECLMASGHLPAAIAEFQRALDFDPVFAAAPSALGAS
jgi:hypothetical protein